MSPDLEPPADAPPTTAPSSHPGPPNTAARNVVVVLIIAFLAASNLSNFLFSVLVTERPLLFIALNAQNRNLALAAGELSAWSFYVVGFLRLIGPDPLFFLLGRWYGDGAIRWMERKAPSYGALLRQLEKSFGKARLLVVAFAPNNPVCLFAGAAGMSWGSFALANAFGTAVRLMLIRAFSKVFEGQLDSVKGFIADYRLPLLGVSFVLVGLTLWSDRKGGREGIGDLVNLDDDILDDIAAVDAEHATAPVTTTEPEAN